MLCDRTTQEYLTIVFAVGQRTETFGQAPFSDHVSGDLGCPFDIIRRTGRDTQCPENQLLRNAATKQAGNHALKMLLGHAVAVFFRKIHRDAKCTSARDDRDLIDRVVLRHEVANNSVARLVVSRI